MKKSLLAVLLTSAVLTLSSCNFALSRPATSTSNIGPATSNGTSANPTSNSEGGASSASGNTSTGGNTNTNTSQGGGGGNTSTSTGGNTSVTPVSGNDGSTLEKAFTGEEAAAKCVEVGSSYSTEKYYVKDTVYSVDSGFSTTYGTHSFHLGSANGLYCFRLKNGSNHDKFTSESDIEVGDTVVVYGQLINYNGTSPEMSYSYNNGVEGYVVSISKAPEEEISPTGISIVSTSSVSIGKTTTLSVNYLPANCNANKGVTWTSNNTSVATVNNGVVTGVSAGSATITVTSSYDSSLTSSCVVTVSEQTKDAWTVFLYMCGADLESQSGLATSDLTEIKSVTNQPDDVNFVVETGGASSWSNTQNGCIDSTKLSRFHLENKSFVSDSKLTYASMGLSSTLQSFLEWGVETYPADKYGLILWNHGGAQRGVCYDEKKSDDSLTDNEVVSAVKNAQSNKSTGKFEFIGYDACLMQLMEIAEFNSPYFNYQVASQESENGYGWDYDTWLDDLYAGKDTPTILKAIADGFITDNGGVNASGETYEGTYYPADQTMSYLDLSQMAAFKTAWESMASQLSSKITSSNKSSFNSNLIGKTKYFGGSDYDYFCIFDIYHFLSLLENNSTFNPGGTYISDCRTAFNNLVKYSTSQKEGAADAHGLCFYYTAGTGYSQSSYNSSTYSNFTNWIKVASNGGSISSSYSY